MIWYLGFGMVENQIQDRRENGTETRPGKQYGDCSVTIAILRLFLGRQVPNTWVLGTLVLEAVNQAVLHWRIQVRTLVCCFIGMISMEVHQRKPQLMFQILHDPRLLQFPNF